MFYIHTHTHTRFDGDMLSVLLLLSLYTARRGVAGYTVPILSYLSSLCPKIYFCRKKESSKRIFKFDQLTNWLIEQLRKHSFTYQNQIGNIDNDFIVIYYVNLVACFRYI